MPIYSYHLVKVPLIVALKGMFVRPIRGGEHGILHAEYMNVMTLGSPIFSPSRLLVRQVSVFVQWENEAALEHYLNHNSYGKILAKGWHVRMRFVRQWGKIKALHIATEDAIDVKENTPVVAVTIARMKPLEVPRFIHWGRPVEKLVRDHPGTTLALASYNFPNTISTFSIWKSAKEMTDMVHGHSAIPQPKRHSDAMKERVRKDFHFEFTTLRFVAFAEHGAWKGKNNFVP